MCTNYRASRADLERLSQQSGFDFGQDLADWKADIWPDYDAPALLPAGDSAAPVLATFGFWPIFLQGARADVPGKKPKTFTTVNARGEEVGGKPLYAKAWRAGRRCLIGAGYVVEPCWETGKNVWHRIGLASGEPFAVAGIWQRYETPKGTVTGVSMLTVNADDHPLMKRMHRPNDEKRSVVMLLPSEYDEWLHTPNVEAARLMLKLLPAEAMRAEPTGI